MKILGKEAREYSVSSWSQVPGTEKQLTAKIAAKAEIVAHKSSYNDGYYVTITVENKYVNFQVDRKCNKHLAEGCICNPKTFRVFKLKHKDTEETIERCFAEPL